VMVRRVLERLFCGLPGGKYVGRGVGCSPLFTGGGLPAGGVGGSLSIEPEELHSPLTQPP